MSAWITVRGYLLSFVVPIAIDILKQVLTALRPEAIAKFTAFLQSAYDAAVANGDTIMQSIIVSIVAPLFGITIVLAPESPTVLTPAEILTVSERLLKAAVDNHIVENGPAIEPPPIVGS